MGSKRATASFRPIPHYSRAGGLASRIGAGLRRPSRRIAVPLAALVSLSLLLVLLHQHHQHQHQHPPGPDTHPAATILRQSLTTPYKKLYGPEYQGHSSPADINRVTNDTLGFAKIFAVGLPARSDKRDAMDLTAALTGFHVEWVDGLRGEAIPDKALPFLVDRRSLGETVLGSWRGHMNAVRRIVQEDLESALILEDDMDWDVRLRPQLEQIAQGARKILQAGSSPSSPYGDGWDVLWIGHCGEVFPEHLEENRGAPARPEWKYVIRDDVTVPPLSRITGLVDFKRYPEFTRWVHVAGAPICSFAYALSQRGARKVLLDLSVDCLVGPFDNALARLCRNAVQASGTDPSGLYAKCLAVTPPVFFHHRAKGVVSGDSDINHIAEHIIREKGTTENIVWSARNNIRNMIMGTGMDSQFEGQ